MSDDLLEMIKDFCEREHFCKKKVKYTAVIVTQLNLIFRKFKGLVKNAAAIDDEKLVFWSIELCKLGITIDVLQRVYMLVDEEWFPHFDFFLKKYVLDFNKERDYPIFIKEREERLNGFDTSTHNKFLYNISKFFFNRVGDTIELSNLSKSECLAVFNDAANDLIVKMKAGFILEQVPKPQLRLDEKAKHLTDEEKEANRRAREFYISKIKKDSRMDVA